VETSTAKEIDILQTKLLLALGTAAWLVMANSALAEEVGTDNKAMEGTQTDASSGKDGAAPTSPIGEGGVEFRRNEHSRGDRTGRSDQSSGGDRSGEGSSGSDGGEGGGGEGGDGGGAVD
jgi:hypothetical protein